MYCASGDDSHIECEKPQLRARIRELEARVGELERERDLAHQNFDELKGSFNNHGHHMQAQLQAVTQQYTELVDSKITEDAQKAARLQAVTRERDRLQQDVNVYQGSTFADKRDLAKTIANLQARNRALVDALLQIAEKRHPAEGGMAPTASAIIARAALAQAAGESGSSRESRRLDGDTEPR